jgi:nitrogen fixation/metabolism regulation signal transduction histidine kinase
MRSDRLAHNPLVLRLAVGAGLIGALAWLEIELLTRTHLYATALVVAGAIALSVYGLVRAIGRAEHVLVDAIDTLAAGAADGVPRSVRAFPSLALAVQAASARLHQKEIRRQTERDTLRALLDTVPAALLVVHADGRIDLANRAALALAGHDANRLDDIPALGGEPAGAIRALPPGGRAVVQAGDGRRLFAASSAITRPGEPPATLIALQGVAQDLGAVEQQAWGELIRVLAHEMMNSLTPIASLSESLTRRPSADADPEAKAALEVIARRSENLMAFVDRYRAMADTPIPVLEPVRLDAFVGDIRRLMSGSFAAAGARFAARIDPPDLAMDVDRSLLEQAVINLIKNALDATRDRAEPLVELDCREAEGRVLIAVSDNGEGVPPERMETIFIPFFTSRVGGSGIGLSLARQIAVAHGGQLTVRNRPGADGAAGATFDLSLPRAREG